MPIFDYNVVKKPVNKYPRYDAVTGVFYVKLDKVYSYYVAATRLNEKGVKEYFLIFGNTKFDDNCIKCGIDSYGRYKLKLNDDFKNFLKTMQDIEVNVNITYIESSDNYDVFLLDTGL